MGVLKGGDGGIECFFVCEKGAFRDAGSIDSVNVSEAESKKTNTYEPSEKKP